MWTLAFALASAGIASRVPSTGAAPVSPPVRRLPRSFYCRSAEVYANVRDL